jgi:hypothetical protein
LCFAALRAQLLEKLLKNPLNKIILSCFSPCVATAFHFLTVFLEVLEVSVPPAVLGEQVESCGLRPLALQR